MLGLKIAASGAVFVVVSGFVIHFLRGERPSMWVMVPSLLGFFGGLASMVVGVLWLVWL